MHIFIRDLINDNMPDGYTHYTKLVHEALGRISNKNDYEVVIDKYIEYFRTGCYVTSESKMQTARNGSDSRMIQDIEKVCKWFIKEDFMQVQKPFWKEYKDVRILQYHSMIPSKTIYETIKKIKESSK